MPHESRQFGYVSAVSSSHQVATPTGKFPVKALMAKIPRRAWQRYLAGAGAKGERYDDWAQVDAVATRSADTILDTNRSKERRARC